MPEEKRRIDLRSRDSGQRFIQSWTNKYLQAASNTKRKAQDKLVEAILPVEFQVTTAPETVAP
jgi:hypothetical protein